MANDVSILALAVESLDSRHIWVLTNWELDNGKEAVYLRKIDDLAGNFVELVFNIIDGPSQKIKRLTKANLENPISQLDPNHKVKVTAYENGVFLKTVDMDTGNAHGN